MKVAFVSTFDSENILSWSGLGFFISKTLENAGIDLYYIGNLKIKTDLSYKVRFRVHKKFLKKELPLNREKYTLKKFSEEVKDNIQPGTDLILSLGSLPVSFLTSSIPVIIYTDCTFNQTVNYYSSFSKYSSGTIKRGNRLERMAFNKAKKLIFTSDWAAKSAIEDYGVYPGRIKTIGFGANIAEGLSEDEVLSSVKDKSTEECNLLFVGVEWERKGADIAVQVMDRLRAENINAKLYLVGLKQVPPKLSKHIINIGFLNKNEQEGSQMLKCLYKKAHFLIVPSRAEAYGLVYCEANAFGVPALATNTGGIPSIIRNGVNGFIFDPEASIEDYANVVKRYFSDPARYYGLALNAYNEYKNRLNWGVVGKQLVEEIKEVVNSEK